MPVLNRPDRTAPEASAPAGRDPRVERAGWKERITDLTSAGTALCRPVRRRLLAAGRASIAHLGVGTAACGLFLLATAFSPVGGVLPVVALVPGIEAASMPAAQVERGGSAAAPASTPAVSAPQLDTSSGWVQTAGVATLWSASGGEAIRMQSLPAGSLLRVMEESGDGRLLVYYGVQKVGGWVNRSDLQAAAGPARVEPSSRGGARPAAAPFVPEQFIASVIGPAQRSQREHQVPASVTIAQAALESDWGRSGLSTRAQNYFGIKALAGPGPAGVVRMDTWEVFGGTDVVVKDAFKAYHSLLESVLDHGRFLRDNGRYAKAFQAKDAKEFARQVHEAGYATDPAYCTKLDGLMRKYNLYRYDLPLYLPATAGIAAGRP